MTSKNACCVWDFTAPSDKNDEFDMIKLFKLQCKKYCFQEEKGLKTGYLHYQGRISLKLKLRLTGVLKLFPKGWNWSPTSSANRDNNFYVCKSDTRIKGPWKDTDQYIPRQIREMKEMFPFQQTIIDLAKVWDTRTIHLIWDKKGNKGKSYLALYMRAHKLGSYIPFVNDYKDLMRMAYCMPYKKSFLVDLPKAIKKDKLNQMYSALETIKNGYAFDDRYHFKDILFDCPNIFVFSNRLPDLQYLTFDRWKIWTIKDNKLVKEDKFQLLKDQQEYEFTKPVFKEDLKKGFQALRCNNVKT